MSNFPNWGQLVEVDILTKMEKKCINVAKSLFLEQNTRDIGGGGKCHFFKYFGDPPDSPTALFTIGNPELGTTGVAG